MGAGRPPKPTALKILSGTLRKGRVNVNEPLFPPPESIACPFDEKDHKHAAAHWNLLAPEFLRLGLLTIASQETLRHICGTHEDIQICEEKIRKEGHWVVVPVYSRKTGKKVGEKERMNIAVKLVKQLRYQYEKLLNEFGGNPASAARVATQKKPES